VYHTVAKNFERACFPATFASGTHGICVGYDKASCGRRGVPHQLGLCLLRVLCWRLAAVSIRCLLLYLNHECATVCMKYTRYCWWIRCTWIKDVCAAWLIPIIHDPLLVSMVTYKVMLFHIVSSVKTWWRSGAGTHTLAKQSENART